MTVDLTKIEKPFGLLDAETRKALAEAHHAGAKIEFFRGPNWVNTEKPVWALENVYRVKEPPKPREWWVHPEKRSVLSYSPNDRHDTAWVHVREVLE